MHRYIPADTQIHRYCSTWVRMYILVHTHTDTHTYIHTYIHIYMHVCMSVCLYVCMWQIHTHGRYYRNYKICQQIHVALCLLTLLTAKPSRSLRDCPFNCLLPLHYKRILRRFRNDCTESLDWTEAIGFIVASNAFVTGCTAKFVSVIALGPGAAAEGPGGDPQWVPIK